MIDLRPCPFCGSKDAPGMMMGIYSAGHYAGCRPHRGGCGAKTNTHITQEAAAEAWNLRAKPAEGSATAEPPALAIPARIIAVDFDGTLCEDAYPEIGEERHDVINRLIAEAERGSKIILNTCRTGEQLLDAMYWCWERYVHFHAVNENLPECIAAFGGDCRKIFAHEYWDDKAVRT